MPTTQEFITKYEILSDVEIFKMYTDISTYTIDAQNAITNIIEKRGGIQKVKDHLNSIAEIENEKLRVRNETLKLIGLSKNQFEIESIIKSQILSISEIRSIIDQSIEIDKIEKKDLAIKPRTIIGGLIGGAIGGTIGGIFWGIQLIFSQRMFFIFAFGLAVLNYGFIWLFTRQSRKNEAVLLITILSVIYAIILGQLIYEIVGYRGSNP